MHCKVISTNVVTIHHHKSDLRHPFFTPSNPFPLWKPQICSLYLWVFWFCFFFNYTYEWNPMVFVFLYKASEGDGIPVELFQILKDDAVKMLHSICQQIWKTQQWPQDWKRSVFIPIPKKGNAKECTNYCTIALISHASKVMLKILQARLQ